MNRKETETVSELSISDFPHNRYEALEESRRLLGIAKPDFNSLLKIIGKAEYGTLDFSRGKLSISLSSCGDDEVHLNLSSGYGPMERSAEYKFQLNELGFPQKQRKLHDFGEE
jgi:hypothetical protein